MAIIVVSHQKGAGGPEIGMALSQRLGYRYVDQELLQDAVRRYGTMNPAAGATARERASSSGETPS